MKGLGKLEINETQLTNDLKKYKIVVTEGIQTEMRTNGEENGYEIVKSKIEDGTIDELLGKIDPRDYIGYADKFT